MWNQWHNQSKVTFTNPWNSLYLLSLLPSLTDLICQHVSQCSPEKTIEPIEYTPVKKKRIYTYMCACVCVCVYMYMHVSICVGGLPLWFRDKESTFSAGVAGDELISSIPESGRSSGGRVWEPTSVFLPGESPWTGNLEGSIRLQRNRHDWAT